MVFPWNHQESPHPSKNETTRDIDALTPIEDPIVCVPVHRRGLVYKNPVFCDALSRGYTYGWSGPWRCFFKNRAFGT